MSHRRRRALGGRLPQPFRDALNHISVLTVIAMGLAVTTVSGMQVARHYGLGRGPALTTQPASVQGIDSSTALEAGLTDPRPGQADPLAGIPTDAPDGPALRRGTLAHGTWIPILMYHYVRDVLKGDQAAYVLSVAPAEFERQMRYLRDNGFTTLTMQDVDLVLMGRKELPPKAVALTFDDGYHDFYTNAAPVMKRFDLTATNYVPTQLVGDPAGAYLTWPEVFTLDREGFEMAAHSQFHVDVSKVSAARARIEIFGARADLESHLGHPVTDWAYPYGGFNYDTIGLVHEAGYFSSATTQAGAYHDQAQMPLLTRTRVSGASRWRPGPRACCPDPPRAARGRVTTSPRAGLEQGDAVHGAGGDRPRRHLRFLPGVHRGSRERARGGLPGGQQPPLLDGHGLHPLRHAARDAAPHAGQ